MRFFRSEEHARRWQQTDVADVISLSQVSRLARAWYEKKLTPGWRRHTTEEAEALFARIGLDPDFWRLR